MTKVVMKVMQLTAGTAIDISFDASNTLFQMEAVQFTRSGRRKYMLLSIRRMRAVSDSSVCFCCSASDSTF